MTNCCKSDCQAHLSVQKFSGVKSAILQKHIPYSVDADCVMICSPVGNQSKFGRRKADIALSGYSSSPEATIKYIHDAGSTGDPERWNSFNTHRMKSGIREILSCLGFVDGGRLLDTAFTSQLNPDLNMLLTQMLCMISKDGSAKAQYVERILRKSTIIRKQAEYSVTAWYERIRSCLKEGGIILLMGNNARNLIENTYWTGENRFEIGLNSRRDQTTLLDKIEEHFRLYNVIHASGIAYRKNRERWLKEGNMKDMNRILSNEYPGHVQTIS